MANAPLSPDGPAQTPDEQSFEAVREALATGSFDFLDLGCAPGGYLPLPGLKRGLGVANDPAKVERYRALGREAVVHDVAALRGLKRCVRCVVLSHFLPSLPSRKIAEKILKEAVSAARELVFAVQPYFDANSRLMAAGFKLYPADWSRNTHMMTAYDFWRAVRAPVAGGRAVLVLLGRRPILDSSHPAIVPLDAPPNLDRSELGRFAGEPVVRFDFPMFEELVSLVVVKREDGAGFDWGALAARLGGCQVIGVFGHENDAEIADAAPEDPARRFLFVSGVPRSGTTALARLLNRHPAIGLGIERFRTLALGDRDELFRPAVFNRERFFRFQDADGARDVFEKFAPEYDRLTEKWDRCVYVGDKIPRLYVKAGGLLRDFPEAPLIFVTRDIEAVAASWQQRADDPADKSWPAENDYAAAVREWNRANRIALHYARSDPDRFIIVRFDDLFSGETATLAALLDRLGLDFDEAVTDGLLELRAERVAAAPGLSEAQREMVRREADMAAYAAVEAMALRAGLAAG